MNGNKKLLRLVLAFVVLVGTLFSLFIFSASAESGMLVSEPEKLYDAQADYIQTLEAVTDVDALEDYLSEQLVKYPETISILSFGLPATQQYLNAVTDLVRNDIVEAFHVNGFWSSVQGDKLATLTVTYNMTENDYKSRYSECISAAAVILNGVKGNSSLTDVQKALLIHDRLALHCEYDYQNYLNGTISDDSYTMYGALANGTAVCQGYSEAYLYLLEQVGIESYLCSSDALNHAWNIVEIGGKAYHVDVTWDDPVWDKTGHVLHENFLVSNDGIYASGHTASDYERPATDKKYDGYFWTESNSAFQLLNNEIYYVDNDSNTICRYSDRSVVHNIDTMWFVSMNSYYPSGYICLDSDGTDLLYNTADAVYKYDLNTGTATEIWRPKMPSGGYFSIYGFRFADGYFICDINNDANFDGNTKKNYQQTKFYKHIETDDSVNSVVISAHPSKTVYYIGDKLDTSGLELSVHRNNGITEIVKDGFELQGFNSKTAGKKTVTVFYEDFSDTFEIEVKTPSIEIGEEKITVDKMAIHIFEYSTEPAGWEITWTSSDPLIVRVSAPGKITSNVLAGSAVISASFVYNGITYSDTCEVSVACAHFGRRDTFEAVPSTCVTHGHEKYIVCLVCDSIIVGSDAPLPLAEHNYVQNADEKYMITAATCISAGEYYESCSVCGKTGENTFTGSAFDSENHVHTEILEPIEPCADKDGLTQGEKCTDCGVVIKEQQVIPAGTSHSFVEVEVAPTCTQQGYTILKCTLCLHTEFADYTDAKGHSFGEWQLVKAPDENNDGLEERSCTACGETESRSVPKVEKLKGDVNSDGKITAADARLALRLSAGLETIDKLKVEISVIDYNGDGKITAADARKILRKAAGLE